MNWDDIQQHWPELKKSLRQDHPDLDTDSLETSPEGRRQLLQLIDAKYGAARPIAEEDVDYLVEKEEKSGKNG